MGTKGSQKPPAADLPVVFETTALDSVTKSPARLDRVIDVVHESAAGERSGTCRVVRVPGRPWSWSDCEAAFEIRRDARRRVIAIKDLRAVRKPWIDRLRASAASLHWYLLVAYELAGLGYYGKNLIQAVLA